MFKNILAFTRTTYKNNSNLSSNYIKLFLNSKISIDSKHNFPIKNYCVQNVSTQGEGQFFNTAKIIRVKANSVYDSEFSFDKIGLENIEKEILNYNPHNLFNLETLKLDLSLFLKSLELARPFDIKLMKYLEIKKNIPMLTKDEVKASLFEIVSNPKIPERSLENLKTILNEIMNTLLSYNYVSDKNLNNKILNALLEVTKFCLINNIYTVDHNLNIKIKGNKELVLAMSDIRIILENLNFSEFSAENLIKIFPTIVLLNNIYLVNEAVIEKLFVESVKRLFSPTTKNLSPQQEELLRNYSMFLIFNNVISKPSTFLKYMTNYKDMILKTNHINDFLYLLTENIFKFVNSHSGRLNTNDNNLLEINKKQLENEIPIFEEFLNAYLIGFNVIPQIDRFEADPELVKHFLYSLLLLNDFNIKISRIGIDSCLSLSTINLLKIFIDEGIFNTSYPDVEYNKFIYSLLSDNNIFFVNLELENKIFSLDEDQETNKVLELYTKNNLKIVTDIRDQMNFDNLINLIINLGMFSENSSEEKIKIFKVLCENLSLQVIENNIEINRLLPLLQSCQKYSLKDLKFILENSNVIKKFVFASGSLKSSIDLLFLIVSNNLIEIYDNFSIFVKMILDFEVPLYKEMIKADSNYYYKLLYVFSNFSLRTLDLNPIYKIVINDLTDVLEKDENLTTENLRYVLESFAILELLMKHGLVKENYSEIFDAELITSLLHLYLSRKETSSLSEIKKQVEEIRKVTDRDFSIIPNYTNLLPWSFIEYKGRQTPLIFVNSKLGINVNSHGKLHSSAYILYRHLNSYLCIYPIILDISKINSLLEFDNLFQNFLKNPKTEFKNYLD